MYNSIVVGLAASGAGYAKPPPTSSTSGVDLAKLTPRQQWLLWFAFDRRSRLVEMCSDEEKRKIETMHNSQAPSTEEISQNPNGVFTALSMNIAIATDKRQAYRPASDKDGGHGSEDGEDGEDEEDGEDAEQNHLTLFGTPSD